MVYRTTKETQDRKDAKRQLILDTAGSIFAIRGYHNTSVKDVVEAAGLSVGSFYFYFKGKEELFAELYTSILRVFKDTTEKVLDISSFPLAQNLTRVITANLWMYERNRDLARIMLIEAVGLNPEFEMKRADSIKESCRNLEEWFRLFKARHPVHIPDERLAALAFESTFTYVVIDWLQSAGKVKLTDTAYALAVYNLQALRVPFEAADLQRYVKEVLNELEGHE